MLCLFVCLFVCLFNRSLRAETHLGPDGTRPEQNAQARLKSLYKHAGQLVYENVKRETDLIEDMRRRKRRPRPLPTIKLNNFTVSLWDKRKEILYPTSTATELVVCPPFDVVDSTPIGG